MITNQYTFTCDICGKEFKYSLPGGYKSWRDNIPIEQEYGYGSPPINYIKKDTQFLKAGFIVDHDYAYGDSSTVCVKYDMCMGCYRKSCKLYDEEISKPDWTTDFGKKVRKAIESLKK